MAGAVGQAMTLTILPKTTFWLRRVLVSGDVGATLTTGLSGESPLFVDPLDASILSAGAYHGPTFDGVIVHAGVPVSIGYTAGSTTAALRVTLLGDEI